MKKFFLNLCKFALACLVVYLLVLVLGNVRNVMSLKKVADKEVLSCCHSHELYGLDDGIWLQYGNFNSSATPPWIWHSKLKFIVDYFGAKPKIVLVERSLHDDAYDAKTDYLSNSYSRFFLVQLIKPTCPYGYGYMGRELVEKLLSNYILDPMWCEERHDENTMGRIPRERQVADLDPADPLNDVFLKSLEDYIIYIKNIGAEPVLVTMPCQDDYKKNYSSRTKEVWRKHTEYLTKKYSLRYYNYLDYSLPDEAFRDHDHLVQKGRTIITHQLMRDLGYE